MPPRAAGDREVTVPNADTAVSTPLDPQKLDAFLGRMLGDIGA